MIQGNHVINKISFLKQEIEKLKKDLIIRQLKKQKYLPLKLLIANKQSELEELEERIDNVTKTEFNLSDLFLSDDQQVTDPKMAPIPSDQVLSIINKIIKEDYDGNPSGLNRFIKTLNVIKTTIPEAQNQEQVVSLITLRLKSKAENAVPEDVTTVTQIIEALKNKCKGKTVTQIRSTLNQMECSQRDQYIRKIKELNEDLTTAYKNSGMSHDNAEKLAIADIKSNMKSNFPTNTVVQATLMHDHDEIDDLVAKFQEALQATKASREAHSLLRVTRNENRLFGNNRYQQYNQNPRPNNTQKRLYNRSSNNYSNGNRSFYNSNRSQPHGPSQNIRNNNRANNNVRIAQVTEETSLN